MDEYERLRALAERLGREQMFSEKWEAEARIKELLRAQLKEQSARSPHRCRGPSAAMLLRAASGALRLVPVARQGTTDAQVSDPGDGSRERPFVRMDKRP